MMPGNETGIECKILGHKHHQLVVGVLVPIDPPQQKQTPVTEEALSTQPELSSNIAIGAANTEPDDGSFQRELQEKDAAFLKRITDSDTIFRAKIAESNNSSIDKWW